MLRVESFPLGEPAAFGSFWTRRPARRGTVRVFIDDRKLVEAPTVTACRSGISFHFTVTRKSYSDSLWVKWHPDREWRTTWMRGETVRVVYEEPEEPECPYLQDGLPCDGGPVHPTGKTRGAGSLIEHEWACSCKYQTWWSYRDPDPVRGTPEERSERSKLPWCRLRYW